MISSELNHPTPQPYNTPRTLTASAQRIQLTPTSQDIEKFQSRRKGSSWQSDAWSYSLSIGEINKAFTLISGVTSRINIFPAIIQDTSRVPSSIDSKDSPLTPEQQKTVLDVLGILENGDGGSAELLRLCTMNMLVAGEFYLIRIPANPIFHTPEKWEIHSTEEVQVEGQGKSARVFLKTEPDQDKKFWYELPKNTFISRMWRKSARYTQEADSSMRPILDDCDDLLLYTRESRAVSRSRIASGLLFLPDDLNDSAAPEDEEQDETEAYDIAEEITKALVEPISDETSAYSAAPIVITGPTDVANNIRYITFNRPTDPMYTQITKDKISRIISSLDLPADIIQGYSNIRYSNGNIVNESLYSMHVEPLILLIIDALTTGFIRPALIANGFTPELAEKITIWYDPSAVVTRPSKAESANFGIQNNTLSPKAWRKANGFPESDAPTEEDIATKMLIQKLPLSDQQLINQLMSKVLPETMAETRDTSLSNSDPESAQALESLLQ